MDLSVPDHAPMTRRNQFQIKSKIKAEKLEKKGKGKGSKNDKASKKGKGKGTKGRGKGNGEKLKTQKKSLMVSPTKTLSPRRAKLLKRKRKNATAAERIVSNPAGSSAKEELANTAEP